MKIITDKRCTGYGTREHPERAARILTALRTLRRQKELPIEWLTPGPDSDESILRAHTPEMLARLREPVDFDQDTAFFPGIEDHARRSVGAALEAMRLGRAGEEVFSLMRPPGHHATRRKSMGFCYLNNIAIAALEALAMGVKRVAVLDFDVHHGNGTEDILLNKPGAAFYSIHQFPAYPDSGAANVGNNCFNFPVPPHTPRSEYREIITSAINALKKFKPTLIGVSAGFDAYVKDPLAQETLETEDYHWIGETLRGLGVPMFSLLEGGYSGDLAELIFAYLRGVAGK